MALTAGSLSQVSVADVSDSLLATAAVSGTTPYTYQWYRAPSSAAFVPAASYAVSGATSLALADSGLTPGSVYYYRVVSVDSNATPASVTYSGLTVTTLAPQVSQNTFGLAPILGMTDLKLNYNTITVQFDPAGSGTLVPGQAVKWSTVAGGPPKVLVSTATADVVAGFVNYNQKNTSYAVGDYLEMSMAGNVMFLYAATAINRGNEVTSLPSGVAGGCNGGVIPSVPSGGIPKVGFALDTAAIGQLVRIQLRTPAYIVS